MDTRNLEMPPRRYAVSFLPVILAVVVFLLGMWIPPCPERPVHAQAARRGQSVQICGKDGRTVDLYRGSYALLIGVSRYTAGWAPLESVPGELRQVRQGLEGQGFTVEEVQNPTGKQLRDAIEAFIGRYGFQRDNRLLVFFSGHGHSRLDGRKGYLVPADAPLPERDEVGFLRQAVEMEQLVTWARRIEAKHALFLFDSCFSGMVFKSKDRPVPRRISLVTAQPVRQFISAGGAGETVPARSVFTPSFLRGIGGEADLDKDGYVTGTELGVYLQGKVADYNTGQFPQYGKIKDPDLDEGDFVFVLPARAASVQTTPVPPPPSGGGLDLADLKAQAAVRAEWEARQRQMEKDFAAVEALEGTAGLAADDKATAWDRFLAAYQQDNPHSDKDEILRTRAKERHLSWQSTSSRESPNLDEKFSLSISAQEYCWVYMTSDDGIERDMILNPGDAFSHEFAGGLTLKLGNAGGVRLTINGQPARTLGSRGQVVTITITSQNYQNFLATGEHP